MSLPDQPMAASISPARSSASTQNHDMHQFMKPRRLADLKVLLYSMSQAMVGLTLRAGYVCQLTPRGRGGDVPPW